MLLHSCQDPLKDADEGEEEVGLPAPSLLAAAIPKVVLAGLAAAEGAARGVVVLRVVLQSTMLARFVYDL